MQTISVMLQADHPSHIEAFQDIVAKVRSQVQTRPVTIETRLTQEEHLATFTFVSWSSEEYTIDTIDIVRAFVSLILAEWVVRVIEPQIVASCVKQELPLPDQEWEIMRLYILGALHESLDDTALAGHTALRKARLYRTFFAYLLEHRDIHLLGFSRFRLKEYRREVEEIVNGALKEYREDKQYHEFLELLRYYADTQETQYETIHVVLSDERFDLFDEQGGPISHEQLGSIWTMAESAERSEDSLVSALITLAPQSIVFHQSGKRQGLVQTIDRIFPGRVSHCSACTHCIRSGRQLDLQHPTRL